MEAGFTSSSTASAPPAANAAAATEDGKSATNSKAAGVLMALTAGLLYGNNFTPPNYIMDNKLGPSEPLDYVFSHFNGIFAASSFWFIVYCVYMRSNPKLNPRLILPALISGLMWAIAQTAWFVANKALSVSIAFPLITSGP